MLLPHRHPCCHPRRLAGEVLNVYLLSSLFSGFSSPLFASSKVYDIQCSMYGSIDVQQQLAHDYHANTKYIYITPDLYTQWAVAFDDGAVAVVISVMPIRVQDGQDELVRLIMRLPGLLCHIEHCQLVSRHSTRNAHLPYADVPSPPRSGSRSIRSIRTGRRSALARITRTPTLVTVSSAPCNVVVDVL